MHKAIQTICNATVLHFRTERKNVELIGAQSPRKPRLRNPGAKRSKPVTPCGAICRRKPHSLLGLRQSMDVFTTTKTGSPRRCLSTRRVSAVKPPPQVTSSPELVTCDRLLHNQGLLASSEQHANLDTIKPGFPGCPSALSSSIIALDCQVWARTGQDCLAPHRTASHYLAVLCPSLRSEHRFASRRTFYLGHTPSLEDFKHPGSSPMHRRPIRPLKTFPR